MKGFVGLILFLFLVACANPGPSAADGTGGSTATGGATGTVVDFPPIDWKNPLGTIVPTAQDADAVLPFDAIVPKVGLSPVAISVDHADPIADSSVAFVYDDSKIGTFFIQESEPTLTQKELEELAACQPAETNCDTTGWSLEAIRNGKTALLIYAPTDRSIATSIVWLEDGLMFTVMGPRVSLTDTGAKDIAERV
jgi:hypothetical protein